jgi:hypothetical protein
MGGGSVMVWGAITLTQKSALIHVDGNLNSERYIHEILDPVAIPFGLQAIGQGFIFQDDNARPHAAHIVQDYHDAHLDYTHMEWPAYSPDFNPIEQAWDIVGRAMSKVHPAPTTKEDLLLELQIAWGNIPQRKITKLVRSMNPRVRECIANQGGPTHY